MFLPNNALEQAMLRAATDSSASLPFYQLLLECNLIALGRLDERLCLETVKSPRGIFHPIFTSRERLRAFAPEAAESFSLCGRVLLESTRGADFILNPRSALAKTLPRDEIAWCLGHFVDAGLTFFRVETYPVKIIKALCILFTSRRLLRSARFVFMARGGDPQPRLVVALETDGDLDIIAGEVAHVVAVAQPGQVVEVVAFAPQASDPLQTQLRAIAPFYRRTGD